MLSRHLTCPLSLVLYVYSLCSFLWLFLGTLLSNGGALYTCGFLPSTLRYAELELFWLCLDVLSLMEYRLQYWQLGLGVNNGAGSTGMFGWAHRSSDRIGCMYGLYFLKSKKSFSVSIPLPSRVSCECEALMS